MSDDFKGKVVLVTGAGSGIGREAARAFASRGAFVFGADLNETGLAETKKLISKSGGRIEVMRVNVSEESEVAAFSRLHRQDGRPSRRRIQQRRHHRRYLPH